MDILKIGVSKGKDVNFASLVDESQKQQCELLVQKSMGPYTVFRPENNKTPLQFLDEAFEPLKGFSDQIAFVIDSSTTRGFAEPSQASLYAQHLGLYSASCFDISEACNGFLRALNMSYLLFNSMKDLKDKYILLINNEQPRPERAMVPTDPMDYQQCISYYVGLSFSNVCTCTLLKASDNHSWMFFNKTETIYANHISIGLPFIADGYLPQNNEYTVVTNNQYGQFCLPKYHKQSQQIVSFRTFLDKRQEFNKNAILICHTFSKAVWVYGCKGVDRKEHLLYYDIAGNLGSCSLPYVLWDRYGRTGDVQKGQSFSFLGAAAGGSCVTVQFTHQVESYPDEKQSQIEINHKAVTRVKAPSSLNQAPKL